MEEGVVVQGKGGDDDALGVCGTQDRSVAHRERQ